MNELLELFLNCISFNVNNAVDFLGSNHQVKSSLNIHFILPGTFNPCLDKDGNKTCSCDSHYTTRQISVEEFKNFLKEIKNEIV